MTKSTSFSLIVTALLAPLPGAATAQLAAEEQRAIVTAAERLLAGEEIPGFSIAVARDGELVFQRGFGVIRLDGSVPAQADTRYRIASISKALTAVAVLQLVASGAIRLEDPAHAHCATYPQKDPAPTIRHLLAHQSGIRHTTDDEDTSIVGAPESLAQVIPRFGNEDLEFDPGDETLYTSWGYTLLGCVVEQASGLPYFDYVREHILQPAAMTATGADHPELEAPDFSPGFRGLRGPGLTNAEVVDTRFKMPSSGFVSTAPDLVRFALALYDGELLPPGASNLLYEIQHTSDGDPAVYTLGLVAGSDGAFYSSGSMEGTTAMLWLVPERRYAVAILANRERYVQQVVPLLREINEALAIRGAAALRELRRSPAETTR